MLEYTMRNRNTLKIGHFNVLSNPKQIKSSKNKIQEDRNNHRNKGNQEVTLHNSLKINKPG